MSTATAHVPGTELRRNKRDTSSQDIQNQHKQQPPTTPKSPKDYEDIPSPTFFSNKEEEELHQIKILRKQLESMGRHTSIKTENLYATLNLTSSANLDAIKSAYRKAAAKYHPDKATAEEQQTATQKMQEITLVYQILGDERMRRQYDRIVYEETHPNLAKAWFEQKEAWYEQQERKFEERCRVLAEQYAEEDASKPCKPQEPVPVEYILVKMTEIFMTPWILTLFLAFFMVAYLGSYIWLTYSSLLSWGTALKLYLQFASIVYPLVKIITILIREEPHLWYASVCQTVSTCIKATSSFLHTCLEFPARFQPEPLAIWTERTINILHQAVNASVGATTALQHACFDFPAAFCWDTLSPCVQRIASSPQQATIACIRATLKSLRAQLLTSAGLWTAMTTLWVGCLSGLLGPTAFLIWTVLSALFGLVWLLLQPSSSGRSLILCTLTLWATWSLSEVVMARVSGLSGNFPFMGIAGVSRLAGYDAQRL